MIKMKLEKIFNEKYIFLWDVAKDVLTEICSLNIRKV